LSTAKGDVVAISKKQLVVWQTRIDGYRKIWHPCVKRMCSNASKKI